MVDTSPKGTIWRARIATVLLLPILSVALVALLFEGGLRLAGYEALYEIYSKPWLFWQYDPLLGWAHEPGARGTYVGPRPWPVEFEAEVEINALGLRGPELDPPRPGERRVLFLGDSMVASFEVPYEQTFVHRLEQELAQRLDRPVRAINGGVRGYGTDQAYLFFRERGASLRPDLVVLVHSGNDLNDNTTMHEMRRPFGKAAFALAPDGGLDLKGAPVPHYPECSEVRISPEGEIVELHTLSGRLLCRTQSVLFDHSALFSLVTLSIPWNSELLGDSLRRLYHLGNPHLKKPAGGGERSFRSRLATALVAALADEVEAGGADFLLIGNPEQLEQLDLSDLRERGIGVFGLDVGGDAPLEVRWKHDSHFNPEGHRRFAQALVGRLEALLQGRH